MPPCGEGFGSDLLDGDTPAVLLAAADQIGWLGRDTVAAILSTVQGKSMTKAATPEAELAQKETEYNKASSNERLVEKKVSSIDGGCGEVCVRSSNLRKRDLQGSARSGFRPRQTRNNFWRTCVLCALLCMVHSASEDGQRPTPMEQDTDRFKDHAVLFACVGGLVAEASLLSKSGNDSGPCQGRR